MTWINNGMKHDVSILKKINTDVNAAITMLYTDLRDVDHVWMYCDVGGKIYECIHRTPIKVNIVRYKSLDYIKPAIADLDEKKEYIWKEITEEREIEIVRSAFKEGNLKDYLLIPFAILALDYFI